MKRFLPEEWNLPTETQRELKTDISMALDPVHISVSARRMMLFTFTM